MLGEHVGHECLLAVDGDGASDELAEVDVPALALVLQVDATVLESALTQVRVEPQRGDDVDGALLEHPGADAAQNVLSRAALEDDERHAGLREDVPEQQPGRAGSDDGHARLH